MSISESCDLTEKKRFFLDNRTMIYVLLEEYTMKKHMTLYNILPSCCFPSLPFSFSIDIRNMFGGSKRVRENTVDEHNIEEEEEKKGSKQSVRRFAILLPLLFLAVAK